jgi:hypothetical protein
MPNLSSALKLFSTPIDPICTRESGLISAPASILIPLAPGSPCPQPRHVEGIWKGLISKLTLQADVWGSCITNIDATFTELRFYLSPGASRHHRSCNVGPEDAYKPHTHSESLFLLKYQTQPRMTPRSRSLRPACQCTVKDGDACLSHS